MLLKYDDKIVSEQILIAQKHKIKAVVFVSNDGILHELKKKLVKSPSVQKEYDYLYTHFNSCIQNIPVSMPQYGFGDPLTPGAGSDAANDATHREKLSDSKMVPKILTIPVSIDQIRPFYDH